MTERLTQRKYAKHRGVSPTRVSQWKQAGYVVMGVDGLVDVAASDALLDSRPDVYRGGQTVKASVRTLQGPAHSFNPGFEAAADVIERFAGRMPPVIAAVALKAGAPLPLAYVLSGLLRHFLFSQAHEVMAEIWPADANEYEGSYTAHALEPDWLALAGLTAAQIAELEKTEAPAALVDDDDWWPPAGIPRPR